MGQNKISLANILFSLKSNDIVEREEARKTIISLGDEGRLIIKEPPKEMIDKLYKKACPTCGNDLVQPYHFCRFCGQELKQGGNYGLYTDNAR